MATRKRYTDVRKDAIDSSVIDQIKEQILQEVGQGIQGPPGPPGERGPQGLPGQDGTNGTNGQDGTNGVDGQDGAPGAAGQDGLSIRFIGRLHQNQGQSIESYSTTETSVPDNTVILANGDVHNPAEGDLVITHDSVLRYFYNATWNDYGSIKGDQGPQGEAGQDGETPIAKTFRVTESGGYYYIDGVLRPSLTLFRGQTYIFDYSAVPSTHPFQIRTLSDDPITQGLSINNNIVTYKVPAELNENIKYVCTQHPTSMGNSIEIYTLIPSELKGADGQDGTNGVDGVSPTAAEVSDDLIDRHLSAITGPEGPQGSPGLGITLKGNVQEEDDLQEYADTAVTGDAYTVTDLNYALFVSDGAGQWVNGGSLQGPKGDTGETGSPGQDSDPNQVATTLAAIDTFRDSIAQNLADNHSDALRGLQGEPGLNGTNGTNGTNGQDGAQGAPGVPLDILTVANFGSLPGDSPVGTLAIVAEDNSGNKNAIYRKTSTTWDYQNQSLKGDKGEDGENGQQGTAGQSGVGISSVSLNESDELVINFTHSQSSTTLGPIRGPQGEPGADGAPGAPGQDGTATKYLFKITYSTNGMPTEAEFVTNLSNFKSTGAERVLNIITDGFEGSPHTATLKFLEESSPPISTMVYGYVAQSNFYRVFNHHDINVMQLTPATYSSSEQLFESYNNSNTSLTLPISTSSTQAEVLKDPFNALPSHAFIVFSF